MSGEIEDLIGECRAARARGLDFPTIWRDILRPHRLSRGFPIQHYIDGKPLLLVRLADGRCITFDGDDFDHREKLP